MRQTALSLLIAGAFAASTTAHAKEYGDAGTIDLGGTISFSNTTTKATLDDPPEPDVIDDTSTNIRLAPDVFYYFAPGLPLIGSLTVGLDNSKDNLDDSTSNAMSLELGLGTGYLLPIGKARIGPAAQLKFINETEKDEFDGETTDYTLSGPGVRLAGVAKMPVGGGGVINAALLVDYDMLKYTAKDDESEYKADITRTSFGVAVGVGVWF